MPEYDSTIEYRDIKGFPGYKACTDGSIWSCWQKKGKGWRYGFETVQGDWKPLKARPTRVGRLIVCLFPGTKWLQVHRLILEAFVGPCPPGMECCHDPDHNTRNNALHNLRWGTKESNMRDRDRHGRTCRGERHKSSKLTAEIVLALRANFPGKLPFGSLTRLARENDVSLAAMKAALSKKTWKHI